MKNLSEGKYLNKKITMFLVVVAFAWIQASRADDNALNYFEDQDQDGLADQEELALGTDPSNPDSDGDGYSDGVEVSGGYDPLIPAPGDRIVADESSESVSTGSNLTETLLNNIQEEKEGEIELLQSQAGTGNLSEPVLDEGVEEGDFSITEEDLESLVNQTLQEEGLMDDEMELLSEDERIVLPVPEGEDEQAVLDAEKKQVEEYFIEVGYILSENADYISGSQTSLMGELTSLITGISQDVETGDDSMVSELKGEGKGVFDKLKKVEVPYVLKDVHLTGVSMLGYFLGQDESVIFDDDDPVGLSLLIGKIEGASMEMGDISSQLDDMLNKYDIDSIDVNYYQDQVNSMFN